MFSPSVETKIDEAMDRYIEEGGPGLALLVMEDNERLLAKGYGYAKLADSAQGIEEEPISPNTIFDLASISKQFIAVAVLMLIDQTRRHRKGLDLDTKLSQFFPDFHLADKISIQDLLNHTSGIPDYFSLEPSYSVLLRATGFWYATMKREEDYLTNKQLMERVAALKKLDFLPGKEFQYSNTGYVILAEIIRTFTGISLPIFLKKTLFDPLKMAHTFMYDENSEEFPNHALCYRKREGGGYQSIASDTIYNVIHGDGNIHTSLYDMIKWQDAWSRMEATDSSTDDKNRLISRQLFSEVFNPIISIPERVAFTLTKDYAAGFEIYRYQNRNVRDFALSHSGGWLGFLSYMMRLQVEFLDGNRPPIPLPVQKKGSDPGGNLVTDDEDEAVPANSKRISVVVLSNGLEINPITVAREVAEIVWKFTGLPARFDLSPRVATTGS